MRVCVVTPWYPDRANPFAGIFVQQQVEALRGAGAEVDVEVVMEHPAPPDRNYRQAEAALDRLASRDAAAVYGDSRSTSWIPTITPPAIGYAGRAEAFARALSVKRRHRPVAADVVHAHVALPAAHAALAAGSQEQPVVVTEHFTGLSRVLRQSDAAAMYRRTVERSAKFSFVSASIRSALLEHFPELAPKVDITPNIVDLRGIPHRVRRTIGERWLYVGTLTEIKNIELLLRSFHRYRRGGTSARLTLVGDGPLRSWVEEYLLRNGLGDVVELVGAVAHSELGSYFDAADVLVHLSKLETFGISTMEAIGAGLPVINLDNGAAREVWGEIEPAVGAILPLDSDAEAVCDAVVALNDRCSSLDSDLGRSFVDERYSAATVSRHLLDVYRGVS